MAMDEAKPGIGRGEFLRGVASARLAAGLIGVSSKADAQAGAQPAAPSGPAAKPATAATLAENAVYRKGLPFNEVQDFEDAKRGLVAALPEPVVITNAKSVPGLGPHKICVPRERTSGRCTRYG